MLVESLEGADEDPRILQDHPHAVVEVLVHLVASSDRHLEGFGVYRRFKQVYLILLLLTVAFNR